MNKEGWKKDPECEEGGVVKKKNKKKTNYSCACLSVIVLNTTTKKSVGSSTICLPLISNYITSVC